MLCEYYVVFGVSFCVIKVDVSKVYKLFVLKFYFDKASSDVVRSAFEAFFKRVVEVYVVFKDVFKCVLYDVI